MNKKLLAVAVAAFVAAPAISSADTTLYGVLNFELQSLDGDVDTASYGGRIGVKGSEDLGGGLKGLWQIEGNVSTVGGGADWNRNTFIGLNGDFGTALVGRYDHPYKLASLPFRNFGDTMVDSTLGSAVKSVDWAALGLDQDDLDEIFGEGEAATGDVFFTGPNDFRALSFLRSSGVVAYVSPNINGFQASVATVPFHDADADKNRFPYSLALTYRQGPIYATVAYEDMEYDAGYDTWLVGGTYKWNDLTVGLMYEQWEAKGDGLLAELDTEYTRILVPVTYNLNNITLRAAVQYDDVDIGGESETFLDYALGVAYNFSNRTQVYANAVTRSNFLEAEENDTVDFGIGLRHSF